MRNFKVTHSSHTKLQYSNIDLKQLKSFNKGYEEIQPKKNSSTKQEDHQRIGKSILKNKLKQIIAKNVQYFTNKIEMPQSFKPNDYSLKLPCKTPSSLYKSQYLKRKKFNEEIIEQKFNKYSLPLNYQVHRQNSTKMKYKSSYQQQFIPMELQNLKKKSKKKDKQNLYINANRAPNFMDTHNHRQYKNWGAGSMMPSMKPQNYPAITDMPFKATTMYRNQFHKIECPKSKLVIKQQTFPKPVDIWMTSKTCYGKQFGLKANKTNQQGFYPLHHLQRMQGQLKSTTEYTGSYIQFKQNNKEKQKRSSKKIKSVAQLQKLIMDL